MIRPSSAPAAAAQVEGRPLTWLGRESAAKNRRLCLGSGDASEPFAVDGTWLSVLLRASSPTNAERESFDLQIAGMVRASLTDFVRSMTYILDVPSIVFKFPSSTLSMSRRRIAAAVL
jgi:hypothetical protein